MMYDNIIRNNYIIINDIIINNDSVVKEVCMPVSKSELLLHPIRLRIMTAIANTQMTASDLAEALSDVPQATLYRHINALVEGGLLLVVAENPVRGTVERVYASPSPPSLNAEDLREMTKQDYEKVFSLYVSLLMGDVHNYLSKKPDTGDLNILADGVTLSKGVLFLSDEEYEGMNKRILELMITASENKPAPERRRRMFTYLFVPQE
jgi:DNA-binding transcriptional ArsR family regulator